MTDTGITDVQLRAVLIGLMTAMFLAAVDQTIVTTALPHIVGDLGGIDQLAWVVISYLLTTTATTPLWGKLSDLFGRRQCFQAAIVIFMVGSALCGVANSMLQLVLFRAVQGIGGGGLMSLPFIVLGDLLSPRERGRYMGVFTAVMAAAGVGGPLLGGTITDHLSWRWIFFVNLPAGAVALVVTTLALRVQVEPIRRRVDAVGAVLLVTSVTSLVVYAIWAGGEHGWGAPVSLALVTAGTVLAIGFVGWEHRVAEPILPLRLFAYPVVPVAAVVSFLVGAVLYSGSVFLPLFLQGVTGASATNSGLLLAPMMFGFAVSSTAAGLLTTRTGRYKPWILIGTALMFAVMSTFSQLNSDTSRLSVSVTMIVLGIGIGMTMPLLNLAAQNAVSPADMGTTTSTIGFARSIGSTFGVAIFGAVLASRLGANLESIAARVGLPPSTDAQTLAQSPEQIRSLAPPIREDVIDALASSIADVYLIVAPFALLAFVSSWFLRQLPLRTVAPIARASAAAAQSAPARAAAAIPDINAPLVVPTLPPREGDAMHEDSAPVEKTHG